MLRLALALLVACNADDPSNEPGDDDDLAPVDGDDDGYEAAEDCDDTLAEVHPGAVEVAYDGLDNDCADGDQIDVDGDGFDALAVDGDDCDDTDAGIHPDAVEVPYDDIDQDCTGADLTDVDADGFGSDDCDDADPTVHPDAEEIWYDGLDQDCRGDCDYDADHDDAVPAEWLEAIADGSACDRDPGPEVGSEQDCDDTNPATASQAVASVDPPDGAIDVDAMGFIEVRLRENDPNAVIRLLEPTGAEVPTGGIMEAPDWFLMYPLAQALDSYTTYTVEVTHACGVETTSFTTGVGLGPVDPASLVGASWQITPSSFSAGGFTLLNYFNISNLAYVAVTGTDGVSLDLVVAAPSTNGGQDLCVPTGQILGADFTANPQFVTGPFDFPVSVDNGGIFPIVHQQGTLEGLVFDGDLIRLVITGTVESHGVAVAAGLGANALCNMFGCVACPDGSGVTCVEETMELTGQMPQAGVPIVHRTADQIALDPACP